MSREAFFGKPQERKAPTQMKFTKEGDSAEGVLVAIDSVNVNGKTLPTYRLMLYDANNRPTGEQVEFLALADLKKKIMPQDVGHFITLRVEGFRDTNSGPMVEFKYNVYGKPGAGSKDTAPAGVVAGAQQGDLGITDADVPF